MSLPATVRPQHVSLWESWTISISDIKPFTLQTDHVAEPEETARDIAMETVESCHQAEGLTHASFRFSHLLFT